ncbi:MAG TPA: MFS transporter [Acidiphilium sp.]|nr:MFS transporter [Acidiphilium sp.]HQU23269.1 MFS transporter [Acidiphilium sp.]
MTRSATPAQAKLPLRLLLIYAGPALPLAMLGLPLLVILPDFWAHDMGVHLATVGYVLSAVRIFDVLIDPTIGRLSDLSRSRFGRRRPFIACAIPIAGIGTIGLFFPPHGAGAVWLFITYALVTWSWTALSLPYWAWGAELSDNYDERQRITSLREGGTIIGILISAAAPVALGVTSNTGKVHLLAIITLAMSVPLIMLALRFVPDRLPRKGIAPAGVKATLQVVWANRPFRRLILAWAVNGLANGLPAALFLLVIAKVLHASAASGPILLVYFAAAIVSVPLWQRLARARSKHFAWTIAMAISGVAFLFVPVIRHLPDALVLFGVISLFTGAGLGADFTIPPAIQADVVDVDEAESGEQRAGLYFAAATMAQKAGNSLAPGIGFAVLQAFGFSTNGQNGETAIGALLVMYCVIPAALKVIAAAVMWHFPLDRQHQAALRAEITARG